MGLLSRHTDRRASCRRPFTEIEQISEVTLSSETVKVIDISRGGLLMECGVRLDPNSQIRLKVVGVERTLLVPSRIVRCHVTALSEARVLYRAAVAFNSPLSFVDEKREIDAPRTTMTMIAAAADVRGYVDPVELNPAFALNSW